MVANKILTWLRKVVKKRIPFSYGRDSIYDFVSPITIVLRLVGVYYVERKPGTSRFRLNFFHIRNIPGWILFTFAFFTFFNQCTIYSYTCASPIILNATFIPISLLTEKGVRDFFNSIEDIDSILRGLGIRRTINDRRRWVKLISTMMFHLVWIEFLVQYGKSYSSTPWRVQLSIAVMAVQRRFTFVWYQCLCDQLSERFRLLELVWTTDDPGTMEQVRLLYQRARETVHTLSDAFGPRILFLMVDISLQCTRFFIFTFIFRLETDAMFFFYFSLYHYYCLHVTTTASDNLAIKSRNLLNRLKHLSLHKMDEDKRSQVELLWIQIESSPLEISVCGLFPYNRAFLLSLFNGLMTVWVFVLQTAPAVKDLLVQLRKGGLQS